MTDEKLTTIKELADIIGVSKTAIRKKLIENDINPSELKTIGNRKLLTENQVKTIKQAFGIDEVEETETKKEKEQKQNKDKVFNNTDKAETENRVFDPVDFLQEQLEKKEQEIEYLREQNKALLISNNYLTQANSQLTNDIRLLQAPREPKEEEIGENATNNKTTLETAKKGFFERLFRK